jgi:hypothetical protein
MVQPKQYQLEDLGGDCAGSGATNEVISVTGSGGTADVKNNRLINVATPTGSGDATNKTYVDGLLSTPPLSTVLGAGNSTGVNPSTSGNDIVISDGDAISSGATPGVVTISDDLAVNGDATVNGKLTVTGLIDPTGLVVDEQSSVPGGAPASGKGTIWMRQSDGYLLFTNDTGTFSLIDGGGGGGVGTLSQTLSVGNTTGSNNIEVSSGQRIQAESGSNLQLWTSSSGDIVLDAGGEGSLGSVILKANTAAVLTLDGSTISAETQRITDVSDPVGAQDVATRNYVDGYFSTSNEWSEILANGNVSGANNPEISSGQRLQGEDGSDLTLFTSSSGDIVLDAGGDGSADGYVIVNIGSSQVAEFGDTYFEMNNVTSAPATPTAAGRLFVEDGALKYIGSDGHITTIADA